MIFLYGLAYSLIEKFALWAGKQIAALWATYQAHKENGEIRFQTEEAATKEARDAAAQKLIDSFGDSTKH